MSILKENWKSINSSDEDYLVIRAEKRVCATIDYSYGSSLTKTEAQQIAKLITASPKMLLCLEDVVSVLNEQLTGEAMDNPDIAEMMRDVESVIRLAKSN